MTKKDAIEACNKISDYCRSLVDEQINIEFEGQVKEIVGLTDDLHDFIQENVQDDEGRD